MKKIDKKIKIIGVAGVVGLTILIILLLLFLKSYNQHPYLNTTLNAEELEDLSMDLGMWAYSGDEELYSIENDNVDSITRLEFSYLTKAYIATFNHIAFIVPKENYTSYCRYEYHASKEDTMKIAKKYGLTKEEPLTEEWLISDLNRAKRFYERWGEGINTLCDDYYQYYVWYYDEVDAINYPVPDTISLQDRLVLLEKYYLGSNVSKYEFDQVDNLEFHEYYYTEIFIKTFNDLIFVDPSGSMFEDIDKVKQVIGKYGITEESQLTMEWIGTHLEEALSMINELGDENYDAIIDYKEMRFPTEDSE